MSNLTEQVEEIAAAMQASYDADIDLLARRDKALTERVTYLEQTLVANAPDMLVVLQMAYRKHHLGDDTIGWDELSEKLHNVLCEVMGDKAFVAWMQEVKTE